MNAYELADQLDNVKYQNGAKPFEMYANMLRQQADRLAKLEKETFFIADSEKQGEPVAWMLADKQNECIRSIMAVQHDFVPEGCVEIPLYTSLVFCTAPQTKPLSNDEILQFQDKVPYTLGSDLIAFARAIEERHGIK